MKKIIKSVAIVIFFGIVTRILGLLIKIYISREIGAEALGFYQIALSAFFLLCALVSSGIPLVISRKISAHPHQEAKLVSSGLVVCTAISIVITTITIFFPSIFERIWGQKESVDVLLWLLPALVATAIYTPFRGALWGKKSYFLLGFTELIEQIIRFVSLFVLFGLTFTRTTDASIAGISMSIACIVSTIMTIVIYFCQGGKMRSAPTLCKPIIAESAPIAIVKVATSMVSLFVSIILPMQMVASGIEFNNAIAEFGVASGMVIPLLTIPGTIIGSIAVILIPELNENGNKNNNVKINTSISVSIIISLILFPIYFGIGDSIGIWLYDNELAGTLIKFGGFILLPLGLSQITTSILNALGYEKQSLFYYLAGTVWLILAIIFLPKYIGIYALLVAFLGMSTITTILNFIKLKKYLTILPLKSLLLSILFCVPSTLIAIFSFGILKNYFTLFFTLTASAILAVGCYGICVIISGLFDISLVLPERIKLKSQKLKV